MLTASESRSRSRRSGLRRPRRGYILIMTLVLIAISVLSMVGLSRHSLRLASESIDAQRQLQRYWGARSCRTFLLSSADEVFETLAAEHLEGGWPLPTPHQLEAEFVLSGMKYRFLLGDENAKLNLNSVSLRMRGKRDQLIRQLSGQRVSLSLRPAADKHADTTGRWFASWGQVTDIGVADHQRMRALWAMAAQLTCWGNGKLNIQRVSDSTLLAVCNEVVKQRTAEKLLEARVVSPEADWQTLLRGLGLKRRERSALRSWFTDRSSCFSLWLELDDGQRRWYHQWVQGDVADSTEAPVISFSW